MEVRRHRIRGVSIVVAGVLLGCTSGSDAVPVPGADAVVDATGPTIERPVVTESAPDVLPTDDATGVTSPTT
ncbi:MAG: hypothetical protein ABJ382_23250, partial [Ilumatobacter sp.]